jgi:hypothetical protein
MSTGGVGPMTRVSLLQNVFKLYKNNKNRVWLYMPLCQQVVLEQF